MTCGSFRCLLSTRVNAAGPDEVRAATVAQQPEPESSKAPNSARGFGAGYSSSTPDAVSACVGTQWDGLSFCGSATLPGAARRRRTLEEPSCMWAPAKEAL